MQELDRVVLTPDADKLTLKDGCHRVICGQEMSDWQCHMFGMGPCGISFRPAKGREPNFFWRFMQRLCFGHQWVKDKKK